ncbi:MAG: hypothetical protein AAF764_10170 [Pseudomonadota bacterium]
MRRIVSTAALMFLFGSAFAQTPAGPGEWRLGIDPANKRVSLYASTADNADMRIVCTPKLSAWMMRVPKVEALDNSAELLLTTDRGVEVTSRTIVQQQSTTTIVTALKGKAHTEALKAVAGARRDMVVELKQAGKVMAQHTFAARASTAAAAAFETACAKQRD